MSEYIVEHQVKRGFTTVRQVYEIIGGRGYIGGSYASFMIGGLANHRCPDGTKAAYAPFPPNDVDIFATTTDNATAIAKDLQQRFGMQWGFETDVAYSLTPSILTDEPFLPIQVVKPHPEWKTFPGDILQSFDMDVCRAVLISPDTVLADVNADGIEAKLLRINHPLRSLKRVLKYYARGANFSEHELLKLFRAWDQIPEETKQTLIDSYAPQARDDEHQAYGDPYDWYDEDDWFEGE